MGGIAAIAIALAILFFVLRRRKQKHNQGEVIGSGDTDSKELPRDAAVAYAMQPVLPQAVYHTGPVSSPPSSFDNRKTWSGGEVAVASGEPRLLSHSPSLPTKRRASAPYVLNDSARQRLTEEEVSIVQRMVDQDTPGSTIAAVVDSMIAEHNAVIRDGVGWKEKQSSP